MQGGAILPTPGLTGERTGPAWEQRQQLGFWKAIVDTVKAVLTLPVQCFSTMRREGGLVSPLLFWILTAGIGQAIGQVYQVAMQGAMTGITTAGAGSSSQAASILGFQAAIGAASIILTPIASLVALFIQAGLTHLCLMMFKAANQPFETTFRTLAYAFGATGTLHLVPFCGSIVAAIWGLIAACIGLGPAQGTTTGKAVGAILIPLAVCCLGFVGFFAAFAAIAASAAGR
jgi:hypothetical protein